MQVWLAGEPGATLLPALPAQSLITVLEGAPRVHISTLHLVGQLRVDGGELSITDCSITSDSAHVAAEGRQRRRLDAPTGERALSVLGGGHATLVRTMVSGCTSGAIGVSSATLGLRLCILRDNTAQTGGAMLVGGGSNVTVEQSLIAYNSATVSGGALQVWEAAARIRNE